MLEKFNSTKSAIFIF